MAKGGYSARDHADAASGRAHLGKEEIFKGRGLDPMLDPKYKGFRECLQVPPYEEARPIMVCLDETGSMDTIPHFLVTNAKYGLPGMVRGLYRFLTHPQIAVCGIGDARQSHRELAPMQIGHFEGEGNKMDQWLTKIFLEGMGGGNIGESYELGFWAGARMVRADAFARGQMGFHYTIADEPIFPQVRAIDIDRLVGVQLPGDIPTEEMLQELNLHWHSFMIAPDPGRFARVESNWRRYFGDNAVTADNHYDITVLICGLTGLAEGTLTDLGVFDQIMETDFQRDRSERARVLRRLEAYANTRAKAGDARPPQAEGQFQSRPSENRRS